VGQTTSTPDAHGATDAQPGGDARPIDAPAGFTCREKITTGLDNGHHNPGQNCQQGCHNFYMSGTLFSSAAGGAPVVGASITFVDADGVTGDMQSNLNGNFWWSLPVRFPVKIIASMCPDIQPMTAMVTAADAGCNKAGCHDGGGGGPGRIHLP
jgi:hypothetical protein